ncbi:hypothetical protein [Kitasatospora sp. GAS1066B]|uniref:hypothetical protein n=1 Tax=Kitasatospora sp. GAS1066B TaxID=3156271 RepID=UPI0035172C1C
MSSDAAILVRRYTGPALTAAEIAKALGLPLDPTSVAWQSVDGADGSRFSLRLSTALGDRLGPAVGAGGDWPAEREYDCFVHVGIDRTAPDSDDSVGALRAFCRSAVVKLRAEWRGLETAFNLDLDGAYSYAVDLAEPPGPEVAVWLASRQPSGAEEFSAVELVDRAIRATGATVAVEAEQPGRYLVSADAAADEVTESLALRADELSFQAAVLVPEWHASVRELEAFGDLLVAEAAEAFDGVDVAWWAGRQLVRYEVEARPNRSLGPSPRSTG